MGHGRDNTRPNGGASYYSIIPNRVVLMIYQFDIKGKFIQAWEDVETMAKKTKLAAKDIQDNVEGKTNKVKGWTFHKGLKNQPKTQFKRGSYA